MPAQPSEALQALIDAASRHAIYLGRYERGLVRRILRELGPAEARLVERLAARLDRLDAADRRQVTKPDWTTARLRALLEEIRAIAKLTRDTLAGKLGDELAKLSTYEAEFHRDALEAVTQVKLEVNKVDPHQLRAAVSKDPLDGKPIKGWIDKLASDQVTAIRRAVREGFLLGENTSDVVKRVKDDGIAAPMRNLETLVRTAVAHTAAIAREKLYYDNADLIKGVRWVSTLDNRTSAVCMARDGKIYPPKKGPRPPAHPNCRSTTVPVLKTWAELGVEDMPEQPSGSRPAVDAKDKARQVSVATTYNDWLKTQPRWFVEDVLGKSKAKLYLDGKLPLDRFVDASGKEYTLGQLRQARTN